MPHSVMPQPSRKWWKEAVVYQVYPASFKYSNGDGLGDIPGVISKIDYVHNLGVDVVWICPMFDSPQHDMGYDISDYEKVYPPYGTVEDIDNLTEECHARGMRVILDLVANHTSDEHEWFKESRSSKTNPKRDWYFWKPPRYDENGNRVPPTNWRSYFAGSACKCGAIELQVGYLHIAGAWDEHTQEYYLHLYANSQPDLNWNNPGARKAIYDSAMRFWLDRGIDGFRVDTVNKYSKPLEFKDVVITDPENYEQPSAHIYCNGPRIHEFVKEMHDEVLSKYDMMTVGELSLTPDPQHVLDYVSACAKQLDMVFHIDVGNMDHGSSAQTKYDHKRFVLPDLKLATSKWQKFIEGTDGWTTAFLENHDNGRSVSRYASDEPQYREISAKMLAMMEGSMTGTIFVYQGQEIGMINAPRSWPIEEYKDIEAINYYEEARRLSHENPGQKPSRLEVVMNGLQILGRDHSRLPMQWDGSANAGFSTAKPWIRVHDLFPEINVEKQVQDPNSVLSVWKKMLSFRKEHVDLFVYGVFDLVDPENKHTFVFTKTAGNEQALVALNFSKLTQPFQFPNSETKWEMVMGNYGKTRLDVLAPFEGRIYLKMV
jgi:oligo-1,6-glucosidase